MAGPYRDPVFTQHDDGRVTVDQFPPEIHISPELVGLALAYIETRVTIRCANASAEYVVTGYRHGESPNGMRWLDARLLSSTMGGQ